MRYRESLPPPHLRQIVEKLWTLESDGDSAHVQRVVADGCPELIINHGEPFEAFDGATWRRQPRTFFAGQIDGPLLLRPNGPARVSGIRFHPHGAAAVFGPVMHELAGRFTQVDTPAIGGETDALIAESVRRLMQSPVLDVAKLARELGLSRRQFERRFLANVGLTPKFFGRVQRFQRVFAAFESANWAQVAIDCGYYDQAHLIRDFKQFTGETPAKLLSDHTDSGADLAWHFLSHSSNTGASRSATLGW